MEPDDKSSSQPFDETSILNLQKMSAENQRQTDAADSLINNSAIQAIVDKFNIDNFAKNHPLAEDIEKGVKELIKENNKLKDTLKSNNVSMNRHFSILEKWLDDAQINHINYQRKLDEAYHTIDELKLENTELKKPIHEILRSVETKFKNKQSKLLLENQHLRDKLNFMQRKVQSLEQSVHSNPSEKESEVYRIYKKFEDSERERRKLVIERDRLIGQEMKIQQILGDGSTRNVTDACYWNHEFPGIIISGQRESQLIEKLKECNKIFESEEENFLQLNSQPDLSSLNDVHDVKEDKSVDELKEEISTLRKQVLNERAICTLCRKLLNETWSKFKVISQMSLEVLKDHESKMKALEISLVKAKNDIDLTSLKHELSDKQNRIIQLESDLALMKEKLEEADKKMDNFYILQSQIKLYEEDFLSMRSANDSLVNDKRRLEHSLRSVSQENANLKKKLRMSGDNELNNLTGSEPSVNTTQYFCINDMCQESFTSEEELQTHIYSCLNLKD